MWNTEVRSKRTATFGGKRAFNKTVGQTLVLEMVK
jgi:hypothetical protein